MKRSFAEFSHQRDAPEHDKRRKALKQQIKEQAELDCGICCRDLKNYYQDWKDFYSLRRQIQVTFFVMPLKHQKEVPNICILKICILCLMDKSGVDKIIVKKQPYQLLNTNLEFFPSV